jgi:Trp operon repressor
VLMMSIEQTLIHVEVSFTLGVSLTMITRGSHKVLPRLSRIIHEGSSRRFGKWLS